MKELKSLRDQLKLIDHTDISWLLLKICKDLLSPEGSEAKNLCYYSQLIYNLVKHKSREADRSQTFHLITQ